MSDLMKVSSNPHIRSKDSTGRIMLAVIAALLPTTIFGIWNFGIRALLIVAVTIASTVLTEFLYEKITKKKNTIGDLSAVVTGLLLALNLPVSVPWWIGVIGGVFAILVVKMLFGGLGQNFMNPALGARCFLLISFASIMTNFNCDAYTGATPLAAVKAGESVNVLDMVIGRTGGTIGETSMLCIVIGACLLIWLEIIDLRIPGTYIVSFVVFMILFGGHGLDRYYISTAFRRRPDAGRFLHGDRLCNAAGDQEGAVYLRYSAGRAHRYFQGFNRHRGWCFLCDYPGEPAGAPD